jgi:hypothetical protein
MCAAWLRFEEEYGTLEDYDRAVLKVSILYTNFQDSGANDQIAHVSTLELYILLVKLSKYIDNHVQLLCSKINCSVSTFY